DESEAPGGGPCRVRTESPKRRRRTVHGVLLSFLSLPGPGGAADWYVASSSVMSRVPQTGAARATDWRADSERFSSRRGRHSDAGARQANSAEDDYDAGGARALRVEGSARSPTVSTASTTTPTQNSKPR